MSAKDSQLLKFIDEALDICKSIPKYFSKYSNKIFSNHQHLVLLVLKQKLRTTYKDLIELLRISQIPLYIGLNRLPHYTTLIKFNKKIKSSVIDYFINKKKGKKVAIDGSGFESGSRSYYYRTAWNGVKRRKKYVKLSIAVDVDTQDILSSKIRIGPRHDSIDFKKVLSGLEVDYVLADKGYDSKDLRKYVVKELKAVPQIPYRNFSGIAKRGKLIFPKFNQNIYRHRSKVETAFSVIKRRYGADLLSKSFYAQKKELQFKLWAYNIDKAIRETLIAFLRVSY